MTTLRSYNYSTLTGNNLIGGRTSAPLWATSTPVGKWTTIPFANTLASLDTRNNPDINPNYPGPSPWNNHGAIVTAWCGACFDEATDTIWLPLQGGHADYAGNEPYKAILNDSPTWVMLRKPSGAVGNTINTDDGQEATGLYADGRPRAIHSYNKPVFVPGVGPCIATPGNASWNASGGSVKFLKVDPITGEGTYMAERPDNYSVSGLGSCYDPTRHAVWTRGAGTGKFIRYNVANNTWDFVGPSHGVSGYTSITYMPGHDCILFGNASFLQKWAVFDCATGTLYQPTFSGSAAGNHRSGYSQPRWVPALGAFVCWDNDVDTTLITRITPPANPRTETWIIDTLPVDPSNTVIPSARTNTGTYGRCIYSPNLKGLILFNSTSGPYYFFRIHV